jgi:hypothetical protein
MAFSEGPPRSQRAGGNIVKIGFQPVLLGMILGNHAA